MERQKNSIAAILTMAALADVLIYIIFYAFQSSIMQSAGGGSGEVLTKWIRENLQIREGVEAYVMYAAMFVNLVVSFFLVETVSEVKNRVIKAVILFSSALFSAFFFIRIGFQLPMAPGKIFDFFMPDSRLFAMILMAWLLLFAVVALKNNILKAKYPVAGTVLSITADLAVALLLIPVCFLATQEWSLYDYDFTYAPALKLLGGLPLDKIYFQYDLLPSLLYAIWLKMGLGYDSFYLAVQASYYLMFLSLYLFAGFMFREKRLQVMMLAALVILKVYGNLCDISHIAQVAPFRLDLWVILLFLIYAFGPFSLVTGGAFALVLVLSNTFGMIYAITYGALIMMLFLAELYEKTRGAKNAAAIAREISMRFFLLSYKNIILLVAGFISYGIMFGKFGSDAVKIYGGLGVAFLPVERLSSYWYFPFFLSAAFYMLVKAKKEVGDRYYYAAFFAIAAAIGNSIYFFGRSHENNILNIAAALGLVVFITLDLISVTLKKNLPGKEKAVSAALTFTAALLVAFLVSAYRGMLYDRLNAQHTRLKTKNFAVKSNVDASMIPGLINTLKKVTNNSEKIYFFVRIGDGVFYQSGKYIPPAYYTPYLTCPVVKELASELQKLLDNGYYVVVLNKEDFSEFYPLIRANTRQVCDVFEYISIQNNGKPISTADQIPAQNKCPE